MSYIQWYKTQSNSLPWNTDYNQLYTLFQTQTLFWKAELSHCLHSGNEAGWKRKNTLSKLLPHVCVSCIRINVVFRWHIETINKIQLLFVNICLCSPVSRYCESQHHVVRVLIAWCGVDVLALQPPSLLQQNPHNSQTPTTERLCPQKRYALIQWLT